MKRAGLLINPNSGKSSGKGLSLVEMLKDNAAISTRVLEKFEQLPGFLDEFAGDGVTDLFISSGDADRATASYLRNLPDEHSYCAGRATAGRVNANWMSACCSRACARAEPVAGLALSGRVTVATLRPPRTLCKWGFT